MSQNYKKTTNASAIPPSAVVISGVLIGVLIAGWVLAPLSFGTVAVVTSQDGGAIESVSATDVAENCEYFKCVAVEVSDSVGSGTVYLITDDGTIADWQSIPYPGAKVVLEPSGGHGEYSVVVQSETESLGRATFRFGVDIPGWYPHVWGYDATT